MVIPVGSMARAIPFHDLEILKSWRAVSGSRGSGAGGVGGSSRGASGGCSTGFFCRPVSALLRLPPIALKSRARLSLTQEMQMRGGWMRSQGAGAQRAMSLKSSKKISTGRKHSHLFCIHD